MLLSKLTVWNIIFQTDVRFFIQPQGVRVKVEPDVVVKQEPGSFFLPAQSSLAVPRTLSHNSLLKQPTIVFRYVTLGVRNISTVGPSILLHSLVCWEGVDKFVNIPTRRRYGLRTLKACGIGNVKGYCKKCTVDFLYVCKTYRTCNTLKTRHSKIS